MKTYTVGARVFLDFPTSGKPQAKVVKVIQPGNGKDKNGKVLVEITKTERAYRKGERLEVDTFTAVPKAQELPLKQGQFFRRVSTLYEFK